jgi:uncharacterized membrane protein
LEVARFFGFLHPALVHFPLVLLLVSVLLEAIGFFGRDRRFTWAAQIILILGTTATLFAFVAGNFAEVWAARDGIPQDPMEYHELLATITSWTFVFLTAGRLFLGVGANRRGMAVYLVAATAACILLGVTGHQGAMLVYNHGAGVHASGLPPLATHEDMAVLLQKQDPDALFYSNKMHHIFGWMVMILSLMLLVDMVSAKWGERLRRFAPLLLLAGGAYLMIFSDQDAWPLFQVRPFRPWSDKEVLMHKTYATLMLLFGLRGLWQWGKEIRERREEKREKGKGKDARLEGDRRGVPAANGSEGRQLHARMMAIFALVGGGLLFTHVHSNAPYANVAAGVYIHHTVMGCIALLIGAVKLIEDALQQRAETAPSFGVQAQHGLVLLDDETTLSSPARPALSRSLLPRLLAWAYPCLMLIESIFLINYNEGLPWFLGYGNLALSAPHNGLIAPLGLDRAEFVYDPATQRMDFYVLDQGSNGLHSVSASSAQALVKVGTDTTAVDLIPDVPTGSTSHFTGTATFLRNVPLFQVQALVRPVGTAPTVAPLVADFEPWVDQRLTRPHSQAAYVCPMHESEGANAPGTCRICGMNLVRSKPVRKWNQLHDDAYKMDVYLADGPPHSSWDTRNEAFGEVHTQNLRAGDEIKMTLRPRRADGTPITALDVVHTKKLHLLIASQDLSFFDHVHPEPQPDGSLILDYTFAHGGEYLLYADCTPTGDRNQVFRIPVQVNGDKLAPRPLLVTAAQGRTFGPYRVALTMTPDPPQTNDETQLTFTISKNGLPLTDIEPFLGAGGHCVILSEDTQGYLHSHPLEMGGERFGPSITFHARFPRPGVYKIWGQFQHEGKPLTADFVVRVP